MQNNIIFIIFILLFIILLSFFDSTKEGFVDGSESSTTTPVPSIIPSDTPTPSVSYTTSPEIYTTTPTPTTYTTSPTETYTTTPVINIPTTPASEQTTTPAPNNGTNCEYTWSEWSACDLTSGLTIRNYATQPPLNGGAQCTTPPASKINIKCLDALTFQQGLVGWTYMYDPDSTNTKTKSVRQSTHVIQVYDYTKVPAAQLTAPDSFGFNKFKNPNNNYAYIGFDNTSGYFKNINSTGDGTANITISTSIPNLSPGHYLLTYYIQARSSNNDAKSIKVSAFTNGTTKIMDYTKNEPYSFRSTTENLAGSWVIQYLPIAITSDKLESPNVNFKFTLFDTDTASYSMVALGGITIQSCGKEPCSIDCTYVFSDWTNCDLNSGASTRTMVTIPPFNGAACTAPPASSLNKNCFDSLNFTDPDLQKDGWQILYNPVEIANSINISTTDAAKDTVYQFNNIDALFTGSYTIVNFNNISGALSTYTNASTVMQTSMQLAPGNYRMTYFVQSWVSPDDTDTQSIVITSVFGTTQNMFQFKKPSGEVLVSSGVWYPLAMEFTVTAATTQPVPIQFLFTLTSNRMGENNAVALGGIQLKSCGQTACVKDCQYVWENWTPCNQSNVTMRAPAIIEEASPGGKQCPAPIVQACTSLPKNCQYVWNDWPECEPGKAERSRTQHTIMPEPGGEKCKSTQIKTETASDCPVDCQYSGWSDYSSCIRGNLPANADRTRRPYTKPPVNGGADCTPGIKEYTTISDCPVDCKYGWSEWSKCSLDSTRQTRQLMTTPPINSGTACTSAPYGDTIQDKCPVNCVSAYTDKCDRSTVGVNKRTYNVTTIAYNRDCSGSDGQSLKNQVGSQTIDKGTCQINCESTYSDTCNRLTGGVNKRTYNVTGIAYNRSCVASDGQTLENRIGQQIMDKGSCAVDCTFSHEEIGCNNGVKRYRSKSDFGAKINGGGDCYYKGTLVTSGGQEYNPSTVDDSEKCQQNCTSEKLFEKCDRSTGGKKIAKYRVNSKAYNRPCNGPDGVEIPNSEGEHDNVDTGQKCKIDGTVEYERVSGCETGYVRYKTKNFQPALNEGRLPMYGNIPIFGNEQIVSSSETCNSCEGYWDKWSACKNIDNRCQRERNYTIPGPNAGSCPENIRNQKDYSTQGCAGTYLSKTECHWDNGIKCHTWEDLNTCVG